MREDASKLRRLWWWWLGFYSSIDSSWLDLPLSCSYGFSVTSIEKTGDCSGASRQGDKGGKSVVGN